MSELLLIWLGLLVALAVFAVGKPGSGGALVLAYLVGLSLIHVPGALIYLDPDSIAPDRIETLVGFQLTIIGMAAFVAGAVLTRWMSAPQSSEAAPGIREALEPHIWPMILAGFFFYFVLMRRASAVPSGTALVSTLGTLIVIGIWLWFYTASVAGDSGRSLRGLLFLPLLPVMTLAAAGFANFGVYWDISCLALFFVLSRRRLWIYVAAPFVGIAGLSLFAVYLVLRDNIRGLISLNAGLFDRLSAIEAIFSNFQVLNLNSPLLVLAVNARLNQNYLVGYGALRHMLERGPLAYGGTVQLWTLIPRALWPGKPAIGGGGDVVSQFTGLEFAPGTSVGAGQVLEFYMNFGIPGVVVGFFLLGVLLMRLDLGIIRALKSGDKRSLLLYAIPGLMMMQPGGNLVEIIAGVIGAMVAARLLIVFGVFGTGDSTAPKTPIPEPAE